MYRILGNDGKEYGPVPAEVIRQWISERRATAQTRLLSAGQSDWKPLAEFPEFTQALNIPPTIPLSATPSHFTAAGPSASAKTSRLAIASLVFGVLGFCGITAIVGLILGVVAQIKISRSAGQLKGAGLAIAGICVSGAMLFLSIPILAGLLIPALAKGKDKATVVSCQNNVRQIGLAIRLYAEENNGLCPLAASWSDDIATSLPGVSVLQCPKLAGEKCAYGFNRALSGKALSSLPADTVMIFEAAGGCNFFGGSDALNPEPPHRRSYLIGFVDGSVRPVPEEDVSALRWEP